MLSWSAQRNESPTNTIPTASIMPDRNGTEIATMYVGHYGIEPQAEGESNHGFRARVADRLRNNGQIIDAHEAFTNRYHDEPAREGDDTLDDPNTGIMGACALALQGRPDHGFGDDLAAGVYVSKPKSSRAADDMLIMLAMALGGR